MKEKIKKYNKVCNEIVAAFCKKQELDFDFWVADEIGGIACFSDSYFFNMRSIIIDLLKDAPKGLITQWHDDVTHYHIYKAELGTIRYSSYIEGVRYEELLSNVKS